jgi:hypothetical protein
MNRRHPPTLLLVFLAAMASAAASLQAAERGGLRQPPLESADGQSRVPPGRAPTGIGGNRAPAQSRPDEPQAPASLSITFKGTSYVVSAGQWYVKRGGDLVAVAAPAGVLVRELPEGHSVRWIGGVPYFHADGLYYVWRERSRRYEILQGPPAEPVSARDSKSDASHAPAP